MKSFILTLDKWTTGLSMAVACALLAIISCLGLWQVAARFILEQPSTWTEEAMRRLLIWMVLLGVVAAMRQGAMVSVDLMLRLSRGAWRRTVRRLIALANLSFLATVAWFGIELASRVRFQTFASMDLAMSWAYAALPVGAVLGMVAVLANYVDPQFSELDTAQ